MKMIYKYRPSKLCSASYTILIAIGFLLTIGRWYSVIDVDFVMINDAFHYHISNLSLSLLFYIGIGYSWLLSGMCFRYIVILGLCVIGGNFVCEIFMDFMNTADILDAIYGTIGTAIAFVFLFLTHKYGLEPLTSNDV